MGHTTCGTFTWWHCGQTLRAGAERVQLLARRLRVFALEVFFLGTAMSAPAFSVGERARTNGASRSSLVGTRAQHVESGPPGVGSHAGAAADPRWAALDVLRSGTD